MSTFDETDLLPISALQHLIFCERQAALIHVGQVWVDNVLTITGKELHRKVDSMISENREGVLVRRGIALFSHRLGLIGKADVVEFNPSEPGIQGARIEGYTGQWIPLLIEYKRGRPKTHQADEVQLCAQGICLEEQLGIVIREGQLYYGKTRRRQVVEFSPDLRMKTEETAKRLHEIVDKRYIPVGYRESKCERCSLLEVCMPLRRRKTASVRQYFQESINLSIEEQGVN